MDELDELFNSLSSQIQSFLKTFNELPSFQDQVLAFVHAIDWTEPWIIALLTFHAVLLLVVLLTRKLETFQFVVFIFGVMAVWCAEYINAFGAAHWKAFSRQNYFDQSGLFISVMFSGPIMVQCIIIIVQMMISVVQSMVRWKRAELKHRARMASRREREESGEAKKKGD